ncbi:hypothetical protein B0H63DRAFT_565492 [Podospora didyma]|uniref:DUF3757 domain-containing protein n=1 Tax=Podospora didyma TaxID=330526 RepID=A0AAE0N1Q8_9PEZI|nr:hypothetical protein B0H63DRAFT_565492 [Podospora didyma]
MLFSTTKLLAAASSAIVLLAHGAAADDWECKKTPEGWCTLGIVGIFHGREGNVAIQWKDATIFNSKCDRIGQKLGINEHQSIYSKLPWTVEITRLNWNGDYNNIAMAYGAFSAEDFHCFTEVNGKINYCKKEFPCNEPGPR